MPFGYEYQCDHCGLEIRLSGLWEFYRDELGLRHPYGHPFACCEEAERSGVSGFYIEMYCPKCRSVRNIVVIEFDHPKNGSFNANLAGLVDIHQKQYPAVCDQCGGKSHF
jgi:hypothetical protein